MLSSIFIPKLKSITNITKRNILVNGENLFDKILVANRGEIAIRIFKTCKRLGIKTVAIYSDADVNSLHVREADEAVNVGPAASTLSYLDADAVLKACKLTGAQAVHPGYGFLSEKSKVADMLEKNGIVFIGPKSYSMERMGDKIESKKLALASKVSCVPGYAGVVKGDDQVLKISHEIGYPVMIKASAGGGGKGMRVAYNDKEALSGFALSTLEARSSFADDRILIEKYIEKPRHIEIQVLGDSFGNAIYLNERECTIQRRNQKVIEEAPSSFLTPEVRAAMGAQAVALAKSVKYQSAGTIEFLVDKDHKFYFLEMNTRLQVEHPITEYITGIDLVEQMIRVASGYPLKHKQSDISINGWALEARVYAEDPLRGFLPSIGRLRKYQEPKAAENDPHGVRCDAGVNEGSDISIHYDPMICKLITYGKNRGEAFEKMRHALDSYVIRGVTHNINFLRSLVEHPKYISGDITTAFIPEEYPNGYTGQVLTKIENRALLGSTSMLHLATLLAKSVISGQFKTFKYELPDILKVRVDGGAAQTLAIKNFTQEGDAYAASVTITNDKGEVDAVKLAFHWVKGSLLITVVLDNEHKYVIQLVENYANTYTIQFMGTKYKLKVFSEREDYLNGFMPIKGKLDQTLFLASPMPGAVTLINVNVGDSINEGQQLCVIEAMKMQNALLSPRTGKVKSIHVKKGATVSADEVLMDFE